ncbi:hypothetical protein GWJ21_07330 [Bacillus coagulans]|uniref:hypothetical protein n=1 Tax=Heyndrickxia coagulans TaxID=1398 RepID=UPI001378DF14|nr:hypothetical protein [Heyndrickxia coagulans]NCG67765.1 hypothetical protein [Heyndrickxia coagulans]
MIRIGFTHRQKQKIISDYLAEHDINKIYCFYFKGFPYKYKADVDIEYYEFDDIIMYKYFYPLLEKIDDKSLIIMDEIMRTQNRNSLTYNCAHKYLNQTPHRIIFEYFPIIEAKDDFMILLDFENRNKYNGKGFDYIYLQDEDVLMYPRKVKLNIMPVDVSDGEKEKYEKRKEYLFDNLGNKHPDTIPRDLQLLAGDFKKKAINPDKIYVARNKRFKLDNVHTYKDSIKSKDYIIVDFHHRRLNFNDFLKFTGITKIDYLCTPLSIDNVLTNDFIKWKARLDAIYAKSSLY